MAKRPISEQLEILAKCVSTIQERILVREDWTKYQFEMRGLKCVVEELRFISEALRKEGLSE